MDCFYCTQPTGGTMAFRASQRNLLPKDEPTIGKTDPQTVKGTRIVTRKTAEVVMEVRTTRAKTPCVALGKAATIWWTTAEMVEVTTAACATTRGGCRRKRRTIYPRMLPEYKPTWKTDNDRDFGCAFCFYIHIQCIQNGCLFSLLDTTRHLQYIHTHYEVYYTYCCYFPILI